MSRLDLVLLALVVFCALGVVSSQHHGRQLFVALQQEQAQQRKLDVEWGQLQLEQSTWAMHGRIEKLAKERLQMQVPSADRIQVVNDMGGAAQ
ncbi:MAG: cell division protein FtsL [Sulfuriferula sp.]